MDYPSLADIAAVTENERNDGMFGGSWGVILILFLIIMMGGGGWGNNRGNAVTEADLCSSQSFTELKQGVARNGDAIANMYTGLQNGLSNMGYETLRNFNTLGSQLADCCCTIQRGIDGVNYNGATATASIATPNTQFENVAINAMIRVKCCGNANLSVLIGGTTAPTIRNMSVRVVKVV